MRRGTIVYHIESVCALNKRAGSKDSLHLSSSTAHSLTKQKIFMKILPSFLAFALGCIAGELLFSFLLPTGCNRKKEPSVLTADSVVITRTDTLRIAQPVTVHEQVVRYVTVSVPDSSNVETIGKDSTGTAGGDTCRKVVLPISQKVYRDSSFTAWVSGYRPQLDSIHLHRPTHYIYKSRPAPRHRWSFGLQAGYGYTPKGFLPYVGVGAAFNFR